RNGVRASYSFFMLEKGTTFLKGDEDFNTKDSYVTVTKGVENTLLLKSKNQNIAGINKKNDISYQTSLERVKKLVEKHSNSYYLIHKIYESRIDYDKADLAEVLSLFDKELRESNTMADIHKYLAYREDPEGS